MISQRDAGLFGIRRILVKRAVKYELFAPGIISAFARCNWCVPIILLSIRYNVCACHIPIYRCIIAIVVYLVQRIIAACVVVM